MLRAGHPRGIHSQVVPFPPGFAFLSNPSPSLERILKLPRGHEGAFPREAIKAVSRFRLEITALDMPVNRPLPLPGKV